MKNLGTMGKQIRHLSVSIEGLIRNTGKKSMRGFFSDDDGRDLSDKEVRQYLDECQAKGWKLIPFSSECEGFDYFGGGCPGHPQEEPCTRK